MTASSSPLPEAEARFRTIFNCSHDAIFVVDPARDQIVDANPRACLMLGYSHEELLSLPVSAIHPTEMERLLAFTRLVEERGEGWTNEFTCLTRSGHRLPTEISASSVEIEGRCCILAIARDMTERKRAEKHIETLLKELRHKANHDSLTGLPNRALFCDRVDQAILAGRRHKARLAVGILDLDRFKPVNDRFGHHYGDELLRQVGQRLQRQLRESDTVARLGGDEFGLLLPSVKPGVALDRIVRKLSAGLRAPFTIQGHDVEIGASIGLAIYPEDGETVEDMLRTADAAMYREKRRASDGGRWELLST